MILAVVFASTFIVGAALVTQQVEAAQPTMVTATTTTADTNNNGTIDRITITFSEAVNIDDGNAANGFASIALGNGCTIPNGDYASASTSTLVLSGLTGCTAGDTSLTPSVTYTAVANCTTENSICDVATTTQMANAHSINASDATGPIITAALVSQTASGGITYNSIRLTYSEDIQVSGNGGGAFVTTNVASSATLAALTTTRQLDGIATWAATNGGDMVVSAATNNTVTVDNTASTVTITFNTAAAGFFTSGSTAPTTTDFTAISDINDVKDLATTPNAVNASGAAVTATVGTAWDVTAPTITTTFSCDEDSDGDVEVIQAIFSENIVDAGNAFGIFEADNDSTNDGTGEITGTAISTSANCDGSADTDADDTDVEITFGAGITGTELAFLHIPTVGGRDHAGNRFAAVAGGGTETDKAAPRITSQTPASGATGVSRNATITIVFSETIDITTDSIAISPVTAFADAWTVSNTTYTITPNTQLYAGSNTVTVTTAADTVASPNAFGGAITGTTVHPWSFSVVSTTSGSSVGTPGESSVARSINITSPSVVEELAAGSALLIQWASTSSDTAMGYVNLYYSIDGGANYTSIALGALNNGSYSWTLPSVDTDSAYIKIEGTDLVTVLASDISSQFQISTGAEEDASDTTEDSDEAPAEVTAPSTGETGPSPVTGEDEDISEVNVGDFIKGPSFSTVYYIDTGLVRRPFMDAQSYFTYQDSFGDITVVTDATLATLTLGNPMLPKAGVTLVKIVSDNKVYATQNDGMGNILLRWVMDEGIAIEMYGANWADYVIDVDVTLFGKYVMGPDISAAEEVDTEIMKTRFELND